jgi:hypothetical protein
VLHRPALQQQGKITCVVHLFRNVALVRNRTILTERPPYVSEVSTNFCGKKVSRGQRNWSPRPLISIFQIRRRYFSIQVAPQLFSRGWVDPVPDPLLLRKSGSAGNGSPVLWICRPQRRSCLSLDARIKQSCDTSTVFKIIKRMAISLHSRNVHLTSIKISRFNSLKNSGNNYTLKVYIQNVLTSSIWFSD